MLILYVKSINLKNYRNYDELYINLKDGINIFYGQNAQGKTNIIESIYLLSTGKSHRTQKDLELIRWGNDECKVKVEFERDNNINSVEMYLKKNNKKQLKVNGVRLSKTGELLGNLVTVIFSPDHMKIIKEGPSERRRFIDIILSQVKPIYYYNLTQYLKVLDQRNNLISEGWNNPEILKTIEIWDEQLLDYGSRIIRERKLFLNNINIMANEIHKVITNSKENLKISYKCCINIDSEDIALVKARYREELNKSRNMDYRRGITQVGPHRDDISLYINEKEVRTFGSQGQQRTALLSLKIAELKFLHAETQSYPVLLLDDVFSELDTQRQKYLINFIKDIQTVITSTDVEYFKNLNINDYSLFNVIDGKIHT